MPHADMLARIQDKAASCNAAGIVETLTDGISPSEMNTLMMEVYRRIAARTSPPMLLKLYGGNAYTCASKVSALALARQEVAVLELAESNGIEPVILSPAAPLGSCSVIAAVNQNKVLSALRGCEMLADPTNMLALTVCDRIRQGTLSDTQRPIHLCATARVLRTQKFAHKGLAQHFSIYGMVSSGKDGGSYSFEKSALETHMRFYSDFFREHHNAAVSLTLRKSPGYTDPEGLVSRLADHLLNTFPDIRVEVEDKIRDNSYYHGMQFTLFAHMKEEIVNIGDGGFVDWSRKMLSNKKERMLISAIGLDRLCLYL